MQQLLPYIPGELTRILADIPYFLPEIYLGLLFIVVLMVGVFLRSRVAGLCRILSIIGLLGVLWADYQQFAMVTKDGHGLFSNMLALSSYVVAFKLIVDVSCILLIIYIPWDNKLLSHSKGLSDMYAIVIGSMFGLHLMVMSVNLLSIFLSIEMVSLASYLLVSYRTESRMGAESGLKYVLYGAAASAILLYGISLLYGFSGTLNIHDAAFLHGLSTANGILATIALVLVLVGIGFKLSFVPVHFWVPDVYQGAPTPITAYLSTLPKIAGFALLFNFILGANLFNMPLGFDVTAVLAAIGIVTMIVGNFAAISQTNVKRILAYSSIGHTGFALMAIAGLTPNSINNLLYYLLVYAVTNIAAFVLVSYFANMENAEDVTEYKGLGIKYPIASVCFVIVLISLIGLPVSAGFTAKLLVFSSTYDVFQQTNNGWLLALMITGALTTVISLFYYIKIPLNLFLKSIKISDFVIIKPYTMVLFFIFSIIFVILIGIFPHILINIIK